MKKLRTQKLAVTSLLGCRYAMRNRRVLCMDSMVSTEAVPTQINIHMTADFEASDDNIQRVRARASERIVVMAR
jgi:hypothetical protein